MTHIVTVENPVVVVVGVAATTQSTELDVEVIVERLLLLLLLEDTKLFGGYMKDVDMVDVAVGMWVEEEVVAPPPPPPKVMEITDGLLVLNVD
jgi:hypothetical protein